MVADNSNLLSGMDMPSPSFDFVEKLEVQFRNHGIDFSIGNENVSIGGMSCVQWFFKTGGLKPALRCLLAVAVEEAAFFSLEHFANRSVLIRIRDNGGACNDITMFWCERDSSQFDMADAALVEERPLVASAARRSRWRFVSVSGADGTGKTTIMKALWEASGCSIIKYNFRLLYRSAFIYRLFFPLYRFLRERMRSGKMSMNKVDDRFGNFLLLLAFLRLHLLALRIRLKGVHLLDRYFCDYALCDMRIKSRQTRFRRGRKLWPLIVPAPVGMILLDAPGEVVHERKRVSIAAEDYASYRQCVYDFFLSGSVRHFLYINTARPIEACVSFMLETRWLADELALPGKAGIALDDPHQIGGDALS